MGEVVQLNIPTKVDLSSDKILDGAKEHNLSVVLVVGELPDGKLYVAGSSADVPLSGWLLDQAKAMMLRISQPDTD